MKNFERCMLDRADFYLDKFPGKKLNVLWSGGIDTTAVICAFLRRIKYSGECLDLGDVEMGMTQKGQLAQENNDH